jgi:predicted  nucleic acid-binding Zn-ribbon protein
MADVMVPRSRLVEQLQNTRRNIDQLHHEIDALQQTEGVQGEIDKLRDDIHSLEDDARLLQNTLTNHPEEFLRVLKDTATQWGWLDLS